MSTILLGLQFPFLDSLAQTRDRRPLRKWGTAEDFFFRRGAQCAPITQPIRNARYPTATHIGYSPQARHKVNCPKGKRGSPGGWQCRATRLRVVTDGTYEFHLFVNSYLLTPNSYLVESLHTKKEESTRFPLARYSLLYPLGVTIASSGVPAAQSGQALPRTKFW